MFDDLAAQADRALAGLQHVLGNELVRFNRLFVDLGIPAIVLRSIQRSSRRR